MMDLKIQVLYVSRTGNTERIARAIYQALPGIPKDIRMLDSAPSRYDADTYFIGFWANRGTASMEILDCVSELHGKNIALFATCGMGRSAEYYKKIETNVLAFLPEDNHYLGSFLCQGKMPMNVRRKYEQMATPVNQEQVTRMLRNFDEALLHPDNKDEADAKAFTLSVCRKLQAAKQAF